MSKPLRVLIVEDSEDDAELLIYELERGGFSPEYRQVDTPTLMSQALDQQEWDIILADYSLPQFSATDALKLLQQKNLDLPFIIVSGSISDEAAVAAMKRGAHDYLSKGKLTRLVPAVEREIREAKVRADRKHALEKLRYLAFYDELTGLPNRSWFINCLDEVIQAQPRSLHPNFAVLLLDLDRYQVVKYSLGHVVAEELLVKVVNRLRDCLQPPHFLARIGDDEFAVLLPNLPDEQAAIKLAHSIHQIFNFPISLEGPTVSSTTSIGMVFSSIGYHHPESFLRAADTAMHYAKRQGKGNTVIFDLEMQKRAIERLQLETDLQQAIRSQQLHLNYQPIISLSTGQIMGFEALVRWQHPTKGSISPGEFIPVAEETGLIIPLGQWVLREACNKLNLWQKQFAFLPPLTMSVNLSGIQLTNPNLLTLIDEILESEKVSGNCLKLEITESILMENAAAAVTILKRLKARKIQISIDDFGTGYSSLSYLHNLPIDMLKIDRSFVSRLEVDEKNLDIIKAIVTLAKSLDLEVTAEGIETQQQFNLLRSLSCHYGQGYLISRPVNDTTAIALLDSHQTQNSLRVPC